MHAIVEESAPCKLRSNKSLYVDVWGFYVLVCVVALLIFDIEPIVIVGIIYLSLLNL